MALALDVQIVRDGQLIGQQRLDGSRKISKIGKSPTSQIVIDDPLASRVHAAIELSPSGASIIDMGSPAGTLVNGARVNKAKLANGAQITIGSTVLIVTFAEVAAPAAAGPMPAGFPPTSGYPPVQQPAPGAQAPAGAGAPMTPPGGFAAVPRPGAQAPAGAGAPMTPGGFAAVPPPGAQAPAGAGAPMTPGGFAAVPPPGAQVPAGAGAPMTPPGGFAPVPPTAPVSPGAAASMTPAAMVGAGLDEEDLSTDEALSPDDPIMLHLGRARRRRRNLIAAVCLGLLGAGVGLFYASQNLGGDVQVEESARYTDFGEDAPKTRAATPATFDSSERRNPDLYIYRRVDPGYTMEKLAARFYGSADKVGFLLEANPDAGGAAAEIAAGTEVRIPRWIEVEVKPGDTLAGIAKEKLGSMEAAKEIFAANTNLISRPEDLEVGMRIRVPLVVEKER